LNHAILHPTNTFDHPRTHGIGIAPSWYGSVLGPLRAADFRVLWLATIFSQLGMGIQQVLLGWLVLEMTGSEGMVGIIFAVRSAPNLVVGLGIGALTDRLDRRTLMRLAVGGMMLASLIVAWLLFGGHLHIWQLLLYTAVLGAFRSLEMTARQVYVFDVLGSGSALQGIALNSTAQRIGGAVGALVAGVIIQRWGPSASFLVMGLSYGAGAGGLCLLHHRGASAPTSRESLGKSLMAYMWALRTNQVMRSLMVSTAAAETLGFSHQVMLPILAKEVLQVGATGLGVLTAFRFIGGLFGVGLLAALGEGRRQGALLLVVLFLFSAGQLLLAQAPNFWFTVLCVTFINVMASATDILHHTLLQYSVPNEQRGRAMGAWIVGVGSAPIGHLEIGHLASLTSVHMALSVNGLALATLALILVVCMPQLRRL
jgi:MFS family permease